MHITLETAENAAKWGQAGFTLFLAVVALINLGITARNGKPSPEETVK